MEILYGPDLKIDKPIAVTIGKFDGLHEGHLKVINRLKEVASSLNVNSAVYTFDVNPKLILGQENFSPLMSNEEKANKLSSLTVDYLIFERFDDEFAKMLPEEFVKSVLVDKLNIRAVIMGENSTFGKDRAGNIELMKCLGEKYNFRVEVVRLLEEDGHIISSTRIRAGVC